MGNKYTCAQEVAKEVSAHSRVLQKKWGITADQEIKTGKWNRDSEEDCNSNEIRGQIAVVQASSVWHP